MKTTQNKKPGHMCFCFLLSFLSCVRSPSFTLSLSRSPTPHLWLLPKTSSQMVTSYLVSTCDLKAEVSEMEKRVWPCPRNQPHRMVMPPLLASSPPLAPSPSFSRWHLLLLWTPGILPLEYSGPGPENPGERGEGVSTMVGGVGSDLPWTPSHILTLLSGLS